MIWEVLVRELFLHITLDRWLCFIATLSRTGECLGNPKNHKHRVSSDENPGWLAIGYDIRYFLGIIMIHCKDLRWPTIMNVTWSILMWRSPNFFSFPNAWGVPQRTGPSYRRARPTSWRIQWSGRPGWNSWVGTVEVDRLLGVLNGVVHSFLMVVLWVDVVLLLCYIYIYIYFYMHNSVVVSC